MSRQINNITSLSTQKNFMKNHKTSKTNRCRPVNNRPAAIFKIRQKQDNN